MKVLIADDENLQRRITEATVKRFGYETVVATDGREAEAILAAPNAPTLALLDWNMPELTGPEVCRGVRERAGTGYHYLILLTTRSTADEAAYALEQGADDFMCKPFEPRELIARLRVGERLLSLEATLAQRIAELEGAQAQIGELEGLMPICMLCHKIKSDSQNWERIERYVERRSKTRFTHGLCGDCTSQTKSADPVHS